MRRLALCLTALALLAATPARTVNVTPVITAAAYAQGDQIGGLTRIADILPCSSCPITLDTLIVLDMDKAKDAFDIYFFSTETTLTSADNAAFDVTDARMATGFAGKIAVAAADFTDTASNSFATKTPALHISGTSGKDLWFALVCTDAGGCDWAAVNDLVFRLVYRE